MQELYTPPVFPGTVIGVIDDYIKDIFRTHSSDNVALLDTVWHFAERGRILPWLEKNSNKHLLVLSATDPFSFQPRSIRNQPDQHGWFEHAIFNHSSGTTLIGNVVGKHYFSYWLEFFRQHHQGRFEFDYTSVDISKVYMCLNRKPHTHRIEFVRGLYINLLQHDGYVSLGYQPDGREYYDLPMPMELEKDIFNEEGQAAVAGTIGNISCDITSLGHPDNWRSFFLNVVTETSLGKSDFISEKTLKPIMGYKPFAILGCSKHYEILHNWGIDTFNDVLGLDYTEDDAISTNNNTRNKQIYSVLQDLKKENLNSLYKSLLPRLIENRKALINAMDANHKYILELAKGF